MWEQACVARGFIPVRLRSSRKICEAYTSDTPWLHVLGLLRNPTGMNPLATEARSQRFGEMIQSLSSASPLRLNHPIK